jgi:ABC-2 type transport system permease protein
MSQILILVRKSLLNYSRARAAISITFVVPIVLIYLFGHVFGLYRKESGPSGIPIAVVNLSGEPAAADLIKALQTEKAFSVITETSDGHGGKRPLTEADVRAALHDNDYRYALLLPADMVSDDRFGVRLTFLTNPRNEIEAQTVNGLLQKTIFSHVPQLLGQSMQRNAKRFLGNERLATFNHGLASTVSNAFGGDPAELEKKISQGDFFGGTILSADTTKTAGTEATSSATHSQAGDAFSRLIKIESEQVAGKDVKNPMAARIVGGYAIMFLLFAVSGSATAMFEEKSTGVFARLLSFPVTPAHIIWARFIFGVLLGIVQIAALFLAGRVFFGLDVFSHLGGLLAVAVAAAAACSAFGILIAAVAPSADAARGIATFIVISMSAVGGAWFPVSFMPTYIQSISKLTIVYWSVEGLTDVLWAGRSVIEVLPKVGILAAMAGIVMLISISLFNRNRFFEG